MGCGQKQASSRHLDALRKLIGPKKGRARQYVRVGKTQPQKSARRKDNHRQVVPEGKELSLPGLTYAARTSLTSFADNKCWFTNHMTVET